MPGDEIWDRIPQRHRFSANDDDIHVFRKINAQRRNLWEQMHSCLVIFNSSTNLTPDAYMHQKSIVVQFVYNICILNY